MEATYLRHTAVLRNERIFVSSVDDCWEVERNKTRATSPVTLELAPWGSIGSCGDINELNVHIKKLN